MAKEIVRIAKLQFNAGKARPGPELASLGIIMPEFTKKFNDATKDRGLEIVPVAITIYNDKSFDFKLFTAPTSYKIIEAANIKKGSPNSKLEKVGIITKEQLDQIAQYKLVDLNTDDVEVAKKIVAGTAKNMGILIEGIDNVEKALAQAKVAKKAALLATAKEATLKADAQAASDNKDAKVEVEATTQKDVPKEEKHKSEDKGEKSHV